MRFRVSLPGVHRIPPANDHVPEAERWTTRLEAPEFQEIVGVIDALRFDAVTTPEHLGMPYFELPRLGPYWMDALSVMAFVAGASRRVRVDTSVLVAPYHHPLALAKAISTMDVLSGGRVDLSVGVGHAEKEFEVLGIPFSERGSVTDETLDAVLELWRADEPAYTGRHFRIEGLAFEPKPVQRPRPPIYIGGNSRPALRRAARFDGWQPNPTTFSVEEIPPLLDYVRSQPEFSGKSDSFEVCWVGTLPGLDRPLFSDLSGADRDGYRDRILERLSHVAGCGVTVVATPLPLTRSVAEYTDFLRWFDEEVIPAHR